MIKMERGVFVHLYRVDYRVLSTLAMEINQSNPSIDFKVGVKFDPELSMGTIAVVDLNYNSMSRIFGFLLRRIERHGLNLFWIVLPSIVVNRCLMDAFT